MLQILEWVENTVPFSQSIVEGDFQSKRASLHSRYYPEDWAHQKCGKMMKTAKPEEKRTVFDEVCLHFSPCFRYFFVERFGHSMQAWYTAKQQYCLSVAVSSIVGHILGIGDRHGANILVHERTGEVVHIDFGIVFEQGKVRSSDCRPSFVYSIVAGRCLISQTDARCTLQLLTVPELVPFRLTQNIVDGLGTTGTAGLFTTASESILSVLRQNAPALLTILSAVVSDPLYSWSMSPVKARERQALASADEGGEDGEESRFDRGDVREGVAAAAAATSEGYGDSAAADDDDQNESAATAIAKIKEKLQGYEDGTSGEQQSVQSQVQLLISSARDPDKLCVMFHGWSSWV